MRLLRTLAAFVVGFVFGVLCLGIGLWYMGSLNVRYLVTHWRHPGQQQQAQQMPAPGSRLDVSQLIASAGKSPTAIGQNPVEPPPVVQPPKGATRATGMTGEANREMMPPPATNGAKTVPPATSGAKTTPAAAAPLQHLAMPISGVDPKKL